MGDRLAQIVRPDPAAGFDGFNEPVPGEVIAGRVYVRRVDMSDQEVRQADAQSGLTVAAFTMRHNDLTATVTVDDVLRIGGEDWQVTGAMDDSAGRRVRRRITAKMRSDG